jgi:prepilin signal peptidase PulO-like enzyme (type II secretory pathway)
VDTSSSEPAAGLERSALLRPAVALVGAVAAAGAAARAGLHFEAFLAAAFVAVLVAISVVDLEERRVPNWLVLPATAIALLAQGLLHSDRFLESLLAGAGAALLFLLAIVISRNSVGMGDVKLVFLIGIVLGSSLVIAFLVTGVASALVALVLIARHGLGARKQSIPFAPLLALGAVIALLIGEPAIYS